MTGILNSDSTLLSQRVGALPGRRSMPSIHMLAVTYVMLVPLIFFSAGGSLSFQHGERNTAVAHRFGAAAETDDYGSRNLELFFIYAIVLILIAPHLSSVVSRAHRDPLVATLAVLLPLSAVWSQVPKQTLRNGFYSFVDIAFVFYLMSRFPPRQLMRLMIVLATVVFLLSLGLVALVPGIGIDHMESNSAWQGICVGKNNCAMTLNFLLIPVLYARLGPGWKRAARAALIAGIVMVIVMTQSRTGWILCGLNLVLWGSFSFLIRVRKRDAALLAALCVVGAIVLVIAVAGNFSAFTAIIGKDATLTGRTEIWGPLLLSVFKRPFLGYGYSTFWTGIDGESGLVALNVGWVASYAHNGYLEVALQLGLLGLVLVAFTLFRGSRDIIRCIQPHCPEHIGWYLATLLLTVVYNLDESILLAGHQIVWMLYLIAILGLSDSVRELRTLDHATSLDAVDAVESI